MTANNNDLQPAIASTPNPSTSTTHHVALTTRHLTCSCCGESAGRWEQFHNRDTGYGICARCVVWIKGRSPRESEEEFCRTYGVPGVNYALPSAATVTP